MSQSVPLSRALLAAFLFACSALSTSAVAQSLPVTVQASGNNASAVIGAPGAELAELSLVFEDVSNLSPSSLGVSANLVSLTDPALLARLPNASLTTLSSALPMMVTIEPPATGGLRFRGVGRLELHTHALTYSLGSSLRVFKAPLGRWPRDPGMKDLGHWWNENMVLGLQGFSLAYFSRILGWSAEEIEVYLVNVRKSLADKDVHAYHRLYVIWGRKPLKGEVPGRK